MEEIIKIKCPFDGAVLSVRNQLGIETKSVTCPVCRNKYPFTKFRRVSGDGSNVEQPTEYPSGGRHTEYGGAKPGYGGEESTEMGELPNFTLGKVTVTGHGISYGLKPGRNVIGRKGQKSTADFQIDTGERRSMSREHIVIDVRKVPAKGFVHYVSLFKERVNDTFIGKERLLYGDCIVLNHGDEIRLPDATLRFEIPDDEGTEI